MGTVRAVFFDVAHTLLDKPAVLPTMHATLAAHGVDVPVAALRERHRLLMEAIVFPDRTSKAFYDDFNAGLVRALGAVPTPALLDDLFAACTYRPWVPFDDLDAVAALTLPKGVLSNWDGTLKQKLADLAGLSFDWILGSADEGCRKPEPAFFRRVLDVTGFAPEQIAYVGDSMRLDMEPALAIGFRAVLLDRDGLFPHSPLPRIARLHELGAYL